MHHSVVDQLNYRMWKSRNGYVLTMLWWNDRFTWYVAFSWFKFPWYERDWTIHLFWNMHRKPLRVQSSFWGKWKPSQPLCVSTEACPAPSSPVVLEEDSVQFNKLSYLGCTWVKAPRNEAEAQGAMTTLRAESAIPIPITLHVPCGPDGSVRSVMY